ncbi:hypothetical protein OX89_04200 [Diaphorobacter sp. J5-51]|nr:hypothetical protein OX89_04200 [Diaphorobacter sp. J5-51]
MLFSSRLFCHVLTNLFPIITVSFTSLYILLRIIDAHAVSLCPSRYASPQCVPLLPSCCRSLNHCTNILILSVLFQEDSILRFLTPLALSGHSRRTTLSMVVYLLSFALILGQTCFHCFIVLLLLFWAKFLFCYRDRRSDLRRNLVFHILNVLIHIIHEALRFRHLCQCRRNIIETSRRSELGHAQQPLHVIPWLAAMPHRIHGLPRSDGSNLIFSKTRFLISQLFLICRNLSRESLPKLSTYCANNFLQCFL